MSSDPELKKKAEAIIFAMGKSAELEIITKLLHEKDETTVKNALAELQKEYDEQENALIIVEEGTKWKLTVRDKYLSLVKNIIADTELSKSVMETLAVIAWKNPTKQSEVIRIRTNKAYDHIKELEELGFITRQKFQRTKLIKLTDKFFQYFELEGNHSIKEVLTRKEPVSQEKLTTLETFDETQTTESFKEEETQHLGQLEIIDEPEKKTKKSEEELNDNDSTEETSIIENNATPALDDVTETRPHEILNELTEKEIPEEPEQILKEKTKKEEQAFDEDLEENVIFQDKDKESDVEEEK